MTKKRDRKKERRRLTTIMIIAAVAVCSLFFIFNGANLVGKVVSFSEIVPNLLSPLNDEVLSNPKPTFTWEAVPGADKYTLSVCSYASCASQPFSNVHNILTTSYTVTNDIPSGKYKWWIIARKNDGSMSKWSTAGIFEIGSFSDVVPKLISPNNEILETNPTFKWEAVSGATSYTLSVCSYESCSNQPFSNIINIKTTSYYVSQNIPNGKYKWWVQAVSGESKSEWSEAGLFEINSSSSTTTPSLSTPIIKAPSESVRAVFIVPGADINKIWNLLGKPGIFKDRNALKDSIDLTVKDIKRMGFNSIILSPVGYYGIGTTNGIPYDEYVSFFAESGQKYQIGIIPAFEIGNINVKDAEAHIKPCEWSSDNKNFVDEFSQFSSIIGFYCSFEAYGQTWGDTSKINQLKNYIESKERFYLAVPGAGTNEPRHLFTLSQTQLNPKLYNTQSKMDTIVKEYSSTNKLGIEFSISPHMHLIPDYGYEKGINGFKKFQTFQRNSVLKYKPKHFSVFTYGNLFLDRDKYTYDWSIYKAGEEVKWGMPRGWVMNVLAKSKDSNLLLYDPFESNYSTEIIGGAYKGINYVKGVNKELPPLYGNGVLMNERDILYYPTYAGNINQYNINKDKGTISLWVKPNWNGNDNKGYVFFSTICTKVRNCFRFEKTTSNELMFEIYDKNSKKIIVKKDISSWKSGEWHHITATWGEGNPGKMQLYIDGKLSQSISTTWDVASINTPLYFGNLYKDAPYSASAVLDDLRIYGSWMNTAQITEIYEIYSEDAQEERAI